MFGRLAHVFLDLNSFYTSVEQECEPHLRGQPVAVVAVEAKSTSCIAASCEAKAYGVRTGTSVRKALRLCPELRIIPADTEKYLDYHRRVLKAVELCAPIEAVESIDECRCRLDERHATRDAAMALARRMKASIRANVGECLTCSIGIAPNRLLAKLASDRVKPDGLVVYEKHELPEALYELELNDFAGVGRRMTARLQRLGISTVAQFCALTREQQHAVWGGVLGHMWHAWLRGEEWERPVTRATKSVGHSHVLAPKYRTEERARAVFVRLIHRCATRLRAAGFCARRMHVYFSTTWREQGWGAEVYLGGDTQCTRTMLRAFEELWPHRPPDVVPTQIAVTLLDLVGVDAATGFLFPDVVVRSPIDEVMDRLAEDGKLERLYWGGMHDTADAAPKRLPFGTLPGATVLYSRPCHRRLRARP